MNILKDITIGQYVPGDSVIHRLDPRIKIAISVIFMAQLFLNESWVGFAVLAALMLFTIQVSTLPAGYILRGLRPIFFLVAITLFFNVFFSTGTILWQKSFHIIADITIRITQEGLDMGLKMSARLILLVLSTSLLTLTTSPIQLTDALENILTPLKIFKVPAHELAMMMTIALRFIPVLGEETERIINAQRSRGAAFGRGGIVAKSKSLIPILVPLFVHAFKHAEDLAAAMESRCYRGGKGRSRLRQLKITRLDAAAMLISGIFIVGIAWWNLYGHI
jgi:energy-coupling factor transport system permease protein